MSRATRYRSLATTPLERMLHLLAELERSRHQQLLDQLKQRADLDQEGRRETHLVNE